MEQVKKVPLISVIISTLNYGEYILEALDSLKAQTYKNWECIVFDDGSTDNTKQIVEEYIKSEPRVRYYYHTNRGTSYARNDAIDLSKGDFIQFLDADDKISSKKFENQINIFQSHPEVDIVYTSVRYFTSEEPEMRRYSMDSQNLPFVFEYVGQGKGILTKLVEQNFIVINAPLFKKNILEETGKFFAYKHVEDWDLWLRIAFKNKYFYFDSDQSSFALVRFHQDSQSKNIPLMLSRSIFVRKRVAEEFQKLDDFAEKRNLINLNNEIILSLHLRLARMQLKDRFFFNAYKHYLYAIIIRRNLKFTLKTFFEIIFPENTQRRNLVLRLIR